MEQVFTTQELDALSQKIDQQLAALNAQPESTRLQPKGGESEPTELDLYFQQLQTIEQQTGRPARNYLHNLCTAARKDLCEKGGKLYEQWQKWGDLSNPDVLKLFGGVLTGMGLSGQVLQTVVIAAGVIAIHLGLKTFCAQFSEEPHA